MDRPAEPLQQLRDQAIAGDTLWFKDAVIYELHVKAFFDADNDGVGDFRGLTDRLDYIKDLGVTAVWLLPFYPSPMRDDGYDVSDFHNVHASYGTRHDFRTFVREAHRRNLKVITELVVNHTSDQHPWFQAARRAPKGSAKRDYYVWSDDPNRYSGTRIIFTDTEASNWSWDAVAQAHYWHRFFSHQPDLNFDNPKVLRAVIRTMQFWLDMGVDGFRLDAIPYLCEREGTNNENLPATHAVIKRIRAALDAGYADRVLLAEANQWPEDVREYFGDGDECHMAYHFPLMPRLFLAIAQEDRYPVVEIMRQTPEIPPNCQWAIFLRNHDELTLEMVTDRERDYMYEMFATDPRMRLNVGIRRRLAPLLGNDRARIELMSFLLFTMPGTPILYYGDEIGMGDNIYLGDRNGVRTPMQWSADRNAGFSRADPQRLYLPPIMDPVYGYEAINVEAQARSPSSLLSWTRRLIEVRKRFKAFGRGTLAFLEPGNRKVLAYLREHGDETVLCVANLSRTAQAVELNLERFEGRVPVEIVGRVSFPPIGKLPYMLTLPGHGYYVFQLATDAPPPAWHERRLPAQDLPVLVMLEGWRTFLTPGGGAQDIRRAMATRTHEQLEREVLLPHLETRRWYAAKGRPVTRVDIVEEGEWHTPQGDWLLTCLSVEFADAGTPAGESQTYFLPLAIDWESRGHDPIDRIGAWALARVRQRAQTGILYGAFADSRFCRALARAMGADEDLAFGSGKLRFRHTSAFAGFADAIDDEVRHPPLEQSNTGVFFGKRLYMKGYRRLQPGPSPEVEVGDFLTAAVAFPHVARVAGWVDYVRADGVATTLALLQEYVDHQGNLWDYTLNYLDRYIDLRAHSGVGSPPPAEEDLHRQFVTQAETLGKRIGELHRAFATPTGAPEFDPEPVTASEVVEWRAAVHADVERTFTTLAARRDAIAPETRAAADELLDARHSLARVVDRLPLAADALVKTRYHGDLHLAQVLVVQNDFVIIDFEGEPARTVAERRRKHSPLRDVAGMIRSADYVARTATARRVAARSDDAALATELIETWRAAVTAAFLSGYRAATRDLASVPQDDAALDSFVTLFAIEKGLYELRYELDNRPDWLHVPLGGLLGLLRAARRDDADSTDAPVDGLLELLRAARGGAP